MFHHELTRHTGHRDKAGAQAVVALHDGGECLLQPVRLQNSAQAHGSGNVVQTGSLRVTRQLLQKPQPLLGGRERHLYLCCFCCLCRHGSGGRGSYSGRMSAQLGLQKCGQTGRAVLLEQQTGRQRQSQLFLQQIADFQREQRIHAQAGEGLPGIGQHNPRCLQAVRYQRVDSGERCRRFSCYRMRR